MSTPRLKVTRAQWIHTAIHSGKYPAAVLLGAIVGGYQGLVVTVMVAAVGYAFEIVSDVLYWRAINLRPRSGAMQNSEFMGELEVGDCVNCGHSNNDHDVESIVQVKCRVCGCEFLDK